MAAFSDPIATTTTTTTTIFIISCPEKFTIDKYMQREKVTIKNEHSHSHLVLVKIQFKTSLLTKKIYLLRVFFHVESLKTKWTLILRGLRKKKKKIRVF